jgi:hypothetical protein
MSRLPEEVRGLLRSVEWVETDANGWDTKVGDAIAKYCRLIGDEVPADELFQTAVWSVPTGTELEPDPFCRKQTAPSLRVDMADGSSFAVLIGWGDYCGCPDCSNTPSFRVVESSWTASGEPRGKEVSRG